MGRNSLGCVKPMTQEHPYGMRRFFNGVEAVYMPDPWTFPEGYGNAWCSIEQLKKDGIPIPRRQS